MAEEEQPKPKEKGLNEKISEIHEYLKIDDKDKKKKEFKLPFNIKSQAKTMTKKNKAIFFKLLTNGGMKISVEQIHNGMINIGEKYYNVTPGHIWNYNNLPVLIQPEWELEPIATKNYQDSGNKSDPEAIIIRAMQTQEAGKSMKFGKMWIWIGLIGIAVIYVVMSGGLH
jgi:hypothetical protein